jgi:hypothetical protein
MLSIRHPAVASRETIVDPSAFTDASSAHQIDSVPVVVHLWLRLSKSKQSAGEGVGTRTRKCKQSIPNENGHESATRGGVYVNSVLLL